MEPPADWLGDADRVADLGLRLDRASVPVDRLALYRRTLHPEILGRATIWTPRHPIEIYDRAHGLDLSGGYCGSPLEGALGAGIARTLDGPEIDAAAWGWAAPLRGLGLQSLLIRPLQTGGALVIATRRPGGFTAADLAVIGHLLEGADAGSKRKNRFRNKIA